MSFYIAENDTNIIVSDKIWAFMDNWFGYSFTVRFDKELKQHTVTFLEKWSNSASHIEAVEQNF